MVRSVIGVIGGSGLYDLPGLEDARWQRVESPWGEPSDELRFGTIAGRPIVFLPRHGRGHRVSPSDIDYRANIDALKRAGVSDIVSVSAVGSYREDLPPGTFVLVDQFVDRTVRRASSFFGKGCVAHVAFGHPTSPGLMDRLAAAAEAEAIPVVRGGTYVCMEGPQFSTLAESRAYKAQGFDVIGMTNMPEARLAREAEMAYATLALATDWDCWHPHQACVTAEMAIANLQGNARRAQQVLAHAVRRIEASWPVSAAHSALGSALVTPPAAMSAPVRERLQALIARFL